MPQQGFPSNTAEHSRRVHCFSICAGRFNCKAGQSGPQLNGLVPFGSVRLGIAGSLSNNFVLCRPLKWYNLPSGRQGGNPCPGTCTYPHLTSGSIDSRSTVSHSQPFILFPKQSTFLKRQPVNSNTELFYTLHEELGIVYRKVR